MKLGANTKKIVIIVLISIFVSACSSSEQAYSQEAVKEKLIGQGYDEDLAVCASEIIGSNYQNDELSNKKLNSYINNCQNEREAALTEIEDEQKKAEELAFTDQPKKYGDDPELDKLWDKCKEGEGQACDQLFSKAPISSEYETFGLNCGNRPEVLHCEDIGKEEDPLPIEAVENGNDPDAQTDNTNLDN